MRFLRFPALPDRNFRLDYIAQKQFVIKQLYPLLGEGSDFGATGLQELCRAVLVHNVPLPCYRMGKISYLPM